MLVQSDYVQNVALDGDGTSLTLEVPPGDHALLLFDPTGRSDAFAMTRIAAGDTQPAIEAILEPPAPSPSSRTRPPR